MSAHSDALRMLARRELSEAQVRQRLGRRGHDEPSIDETVERLKADGSINDERVAAVIARSETSMRRRGRRRVLQQIEAAGIAASTASRAVDEVFQEIDADALLAASLDRRLRGRERIADDREFQRLYRYLMAQGFEADRVLQLLRQRR